MNEAEPVIFQIGGVDMLYLSIIVLFLGMYLNKKIRFLAENYIPPAVTGGLLFSAGSAVLYAFADIELAFDMGLRDLLLLMFFSTIGLSARFSTLVSGGKALILLVLVAGIFLIIQDATGVGLVMLLGERPGYGLMGGSVSLAGGHGTAIAWGREAVAAGLTDAKEVGLAMATFGMILGGTMGGPIARYLMNKHDLHGMQGAEMVGSGADAVKAPGDQAFNILRALMILAICVSLGDLVNRFLFSQGVLLPGFLTAMLVAIVITNINDALKIPVSEKVVSVFGDISLSLFLSMSMMSIQLWVLAGGLSLLTLVLVGQAIVMTLFATFVVFRVMGRDYDAVVISAGFVGLGLGATPVAIANMESVTNKFGPSAKAFLIVPLVGAFFIDLMNATVIKLFIGIITRWLI
jgi:ESS family glutamate:Na+ symporter